MEATAARRRWFWPRPAWLVWGAAAATGVLFACERWRWFPHHYQKGWPVLAAVAVVGSLLLLILAWVIVGLLFRRRAQFGLRTLLVFVTLCAVVCSWFSVRLREARRQAEVVAAIPANLHPAVAYDWECAELRVLLRDPPRPPPDPLMKMLGVDFFGNADTVWLCSSDVTDASLEYVATLPRLSYLDVTADKLTDAGLSHLEGLTNLRFLRLAHTKVTDEGVKKLQRALPACEIYRLAPLKQ